MFNAGNLYKINLNHFFELKYNCAHTFHNTLIGCDVFLWIPGPQGLSHPQNPKAGRTPAVFLRQVWLRQKGGQHMWTSTGQGWLEIKIIKEKSALKIKHQVLSSFKKIKITFKMRSLTNDNRTKTSLASAFVLFKVQKFCQPYLHRSWTTAARKKASGIRTAGTSSTRLREQSGSGPSERLRKVCWHQIV